MANILVVDDGALITSWLTEILRREGYSVQVAHDEQQAVRIYGEFLHDLVVTELFMPESVGLDMITQLLYRNPDVRILAITGGELIHPDSLLSAASVIGAVRILRKPFSLENFLLTVEEHLSGGPEIH